MAFLAQSLDFSAVMQILDFWPPELREYIYIYTPLREVYILREYIYIDLVLCYQVYGNFFQWP